MSATFIFMMLVLKIPIAALIWLVWWAIHQTPEPADDGSLGDGGSRTRPHPRHPHPPFPRHPRRGPHGDPAPPSPPRTRTTVARGRRVER